MKGKGRMTDNLGHDDSAYHEYLQHLVYAEDLGLNFPQSHSHPSLRISEPDPNVTPLLTSQSENMPNLGHDGDEPDGSDPNSHQDFDFDPQMEEKLPKQVKSDLFIVHMKKVMQEDGSTVVICNYCKKIFKWHKSGGYDTYQKHITNSHPDAQAKSSSQAQIPKCACHVFNLCVQKGLKTLEQFIQPIKDALYFLWKHPYVMKSWAAYCKQNGRLAIRFPRDVPTRSSSSSSTTYSELESYLSTSFEFIEDTKDKKFDILHWWNEHERYFLILAMIAKQILSTPVSTVAVEQQFNAGGNILFPKRSPMSPKSLQIQACVEDWTKAQYRQQEIHKEEPYDFFKDDQPAESQTDNHGND
ncbi:hypothetical protein Dsin_001981 [Dipteronia sinensis]|uniref:HAT C-terminal dimerisation domain-containing protein n=1 Tax=Dipteronia sinensis TaxID=43782 RepID=A0AAE0B6A4_9ROSI|nr:hypothetical protein Dsin_001981 [Dipteronia sinensis]